MTLALEIVLGAIILFIVVIVRWRLASRHSSLPCPSWLAWLVERDNPHAHNYSAGSIIERLHLRPGMRVLDAGCGPGRVTIPLAQAVGPQGKVDAIDIQTRMLRRARGKAEAAGLANIRFLEMAIEAGKLESNHYDRAVLVAVLGEIPDRQSALREIYRSLKPGGTLSISEIVMDPHYQSRGRILSLTSAVGFQEKTFFGNWFAFTMHLTKSEETK
jgi:ubiquinone/menaquinone biosynthesis C-methylase UbiE